MEGERAQTVNQVLDWLYGVLVSPAEVFRSPAEEKPVIPAVLFLLLVAIVGSIADPAGSPDALQQVLEVVEIEMAHGPMTALLATANFVGSAPAIAVLFAVSSFFRGVGDFAGMFSAISFARLSTLFAAAAGLVRQAPAVVPVGTIISVGIGLWGMVLGILALRESRGLTTGVSIAVYVLTGIVFALIGTMLVMPILLRTTL